MIEPDKVGEEGLAFWQMYQFGGDCGTATRRSRPRISWPATFGLGSATQSPWPFRVEAATGRVREEYSAHVISAIELFDELVTARLGDTAAYARPASIAWTWLMAYPMKNNLWSNYFEDVPIRTDLGNVTPDERADDRAVPAAASRVRPSCGSHMCAP